LLAKVRMLGMYGTERNPLTDEYLTQLSNGNIRDQMAAKYGQALQFYKAKKYDQARSILESLLEKNPGNDWFLDLATDVDVEQKHAPQAIVRLEKANAETSKNPVLLLNLANAYLEGGQPANASRILNRYTFNYPNDPNGWDLLSQASGAQGLRAQELAARAESMALMGQLDQAIELLSNASALQKLGSLEQSRYDARIDQLRQLQKRFRQYQKG
jgi:predicted Zn-dependent protease